MRSFSRTQILLGALGILGIVLFGAWSEFQTLPDGHTHFWVFDIGQGDGLLIQSPSGRQIVIDGGPNLSLLEKLNDVLPRFDRSIDLLILSHPHIDHLAAFPEILRRYSVSAVMLSGVRYPNERYEEMLREMQKRHVPIIIPDPGKDLDFGDGLVLDILLPQTRYYGASIPSDHVHESMVVVRALFPGGSIMLTGDMEEDLENELLQSGVDVTASILKLGHHGSRTSTSTGFLLEVHPSLATASAGKGNQFKHPHMEIVKRLERFDVQLHMTANAGNLHLTW